MNSFNDFINSKTPALVDFSAEWCGPCKMMAPILKEVAGALGDAVKILKVDVDRNPKAAAFYKVQGVPTLILFREGNILWRQSGAIPAQQLISIIKSHIKN